MIAKELIHHHVAQIPALIHQQVVRKLRLIALCVGQVGMTMILPPF